MLLATVTKEIDNYAFPQILNSFSAIREHSQGFHGRLTYQPYS